MTIGGLKQGKRVSQGDRSQPARPASVNIFRHRAKKLAGKTLAKESADVGSTVTDPADSDRVRAPLVSRSDAGRDRWHAVPDADHPVQKTPGASPRYRTHVIVTSRSSVISRIAYFGPSWPKPLSFTPP